MEQTHTSVENVPPSVLERESDPDKDPNPNRGTDVMTTEDVAPASIEDTLEAGECPFCDEYDGDYPERHAPKAHPDEWAEHKED